MALFETIRSNYMLHYDATFEERSARPGQTFLETALQIGGRTCASPFTADILRRTDAGDQLVELSVDPNPRLGWGTCSHGGMSISGQPARRGAVSIETLPTFEPSVAFDRWFDIWMDVEGTRKSGHPRFSEVIQSAAFADGALFVDLGSAPVASMVGMLI